MGALVEASKQEKRVEEVSIDVFHGMIYTIKRMRVVSKRGCSVNLAYS